MSHFSREIIFFDMLKKSISRSKTVILKKEPVSFLLK